MLYIVDFLYFITNILSFFKKTLRAMTQPRYEFHKMKDNTVTRHAEVQTKFAYLRIFPEIDETFLVLDPDKKQVFVKCDPNIYFKGDHIFYDHSQNIVCKELLTTVCEELVKGGNCLILVYGGKGCGKTLTCFGFNEQYLNRGLAVRLAESLFEYKKENCKVSSLNISMSFLEFKPKVVTDLLVGKKIINVQNVKMKDVTTLCEALSLMFAADKNRQKVQAQYGPSHLNSAVLTLQVKNTSLLRTNPTNTIGKIQIVDVAGLEVRNQKYSSFSKIEPAGNVALMEISYMICKLHWGVKGFPIYFSPLLIHLSDTMGPENLIKCVGHVSGTKSNILSLKAVFRLAKKLTPISYGSLEIRQELNADLTIEMLTREIKMLKEDILHSEMINQQEHEIFMNKERLGQIKRAVVDYLNNRRTNVGVLSVVKANTAIKLLKDFYDMWRDEKQIMEDQIEEYKRSATYFADKKGSQVKLGDKKKANQRGLKLRGQSPISPTSTETDSKISKFLEVEPKGTLVPDGITVGTARGSVQSKQVIKVLSKPRKQNAPVAKISSLMTVEGEHMSIDESVDSKSILNISEVEKSPGKLDEYINRLQREYMSMYMTLKQTQAALLALKVNIESESTTSETLIRAITLQEFSDNAKMSEEKVGLLHKSLQEMEQQMKLATMLLTKQTNPNKQEHIRVYKSPSHITMCDAQWRDSFKHLQNIYQDKQREFNFKGTKR